MHWLIIVVSSIVALLLLPVVLYTLLVVVRVQNHSMSPTLEDGDRVLAIRYWPQKLIKNGQIVLVWPKWSSSYNTNLFALTPFIKRVVGVPGDMLVTNISELDSLHRVSQASFHDAKGNRMWHVPPGHIFVRGDNPIGGCDSLSWGPIPNRSVLGLVVMRLPQHLSWHYQRIPDRKDVTGNEHLQTGQLAPAFQAKTLDDQVVTLSSYAGRTIAFIFLLPDSLYELAARSETLASRAKQIGAEIVAVSLGEAAVTTDRAGDSGVEFPILLVPAYGNSLMRDFKLIGVPVCCVISALGKVQYMGKPTLDFDTLLPAEKGFAPE